MKLALSLLFILPLAGQDFTAIEQSAREELERLRVPGAAIAIVRGDQVIFAKGFGTANVETGEPVRPEMLFRLGSTTKMLTATALVGLAVEGKLDLSAPVGKYIASLPPKLGAVTANQLLSHTAGLLDVAPMYGSHDDEALGKGIRAFTDGWLFTTPGKIFSYSNPGYWMAGYLVEVFSGKPYADAMEERVFRPLAMTRTTLRPTIAMTYPLAQGHEESGGKPAIARPAADNAGSWPAGSVFSNTTDLAKYVIAFLNHRGIDGKVIELLSSPHAPYPDSPDSYGYGLTIRTVRGVPVLEHGGSRSGYGSFIRLAPSQKIGIIVQTNRSGANLPATVEKASELMLPMAARPATEAKASLPINAADLRRVAGYFRNGEQEISITARDGRLILRRGSTEEPLVKHSETRFAASRGGEYIVTAGADGIVQFVTSGSRSFARLR